MYSIYYLRSPEHEVHVIYTKQERAKKLSALKRNAKNGMVGALYDYLRKVNYETYLELCINGDIGSHTPNLEIAKKFRIEHMRVMKRKYLKEFDDEVEAIKEDSEELEDSKKNNKPEVCKLIEKSIEDNNKKIENIKIHVNKLYPHPPIMPLRNDLF